MVKLLAFSEIGKSAKDLLTGGYQLNQKFTTSTKTASGVEFTVSGVKKDEALDGDLKLAYKADVYNADVKVDSGSKLTANISSSSLAPGLKLGLTGSIPDKASGKLNFDYIQPFYTVKGNLGLTSAPKAECSVSVGHAGLALGAEAGFCTKTNAITKWAAGAAYTGPDYKAAVLLADKGDTLKASYVQSINSSSTVGGEMVRKMAKASSTFTLGGSHRLEGGALTKGKIDNTGMASLLYEQEVQPKTKIAFTVQFDTMNLDKSAKSGIAIDMKA